MKKITLVLIFVSFFGFAQKDEKDIEAKKIFLNLQVSDKIRDMWVNKVSKTFEQDEKQWKEDYSDPQIIKNAIIDSLYTIPDEIIAESFSGYFKSSYSTEELKQLNNYLSNELLRGFFFKTHDLLNLIKTSTSSQVDTGLFIGIIHDVLRKNEKYKRKK